MDKITEQQLRYCINTALGKHSPIKIMLKLIIVGRIWVQDIIIAEFNPSHKEPKNDRER